MKTILGFLIFAGSLTSSLNAQEEGSILEKTYIDPNRVLFMEDMICVNMDDFWVQTPAVHVDNNGYYIDSFQVVGSLSWQCVCGKNNEKYRETCKKCGRTKT